MTSLGGMVAELEYQDAESPFLLNFLVREDARGELKAIEFTEIPFQVNRYFSVSVTGPDLFRGRHAHKECWQAFFSCVGSQEIVIKNLSGVETHVLKPDQLLIIPPFNWCEIRFNSNNSIMGVLASHPYDQEEYLIAEPPL